MSKKLLTILFTVSYIFGLAAFFKAAVIPFAVVLFLFLIFMLIRRVISEKIMIVSALLFLTAFLNVSLRDKDHDFLASYAPSSDITVEGTVISLPTSSDLNFTKFTLETENFTPYGKNTEYSKSKVLVNLFAPKDKFSEIEIGNKLRLKGRLTKPKRASNPYEFCYAAYLKNQHIFSRLYVYEDDFKIISLPEKPLLKFLFNLNRIRKNIIGIHSKNIHSPSLELLGGIVFGDDAVNPTPEMKNSFVNSGLMHIIAASGMNVSLIFGMWFFISQILRINYRLSIFIGMLSIICYTCMTGFGPPVLRAALMLLLILFGKLIDRKADPVSLLFIVAFILLFISPSMLLNIGFQLSFCVTLGLLLFCPVILGRIKNKILYASASFVIIPLIAQFFAAPVQMFYFNTFTPYSVFANISVVPTLSIISFGGFLSCIFAVIKPVAEFVVKFFDILLYPFLKYVNIVAGYFAGLPYSSVTVPTPSLMNLLLYYLIILFLYLLLINEDKKKYVCFLSGSFILFCFSLFSLPSKNSEILFFDVGNADSALIKTPSGKYIMIDTGKAPYNDFSPSAERIMYNYFKNEGINKLDAVIVTHNDSDHSGGTPFLIQNIKIDKLFVRRKPIAVAVSDRDKTTKENDYAVKDNQATVKIFQAAFEKNVPIIIPDNGSVLLSDDTFGISAYYTESNDDNDSSIVNVYSDVFGNKVLFCADADVNSLIKMSDKFPSKTNILKVSHHGAKNTVSDSFLNIIKPSFALVSTGMNIYGHPDDETLKTLKNNNVRVLRTDRDNAVKFILQKDKILVYSYNTRIKKFEKIYD